MCWYYTIARFVPGNDSVSFVLYCDKRFSGTAFLCSAPLSNTRALTVGVTAIGCKTSGRLRRTRLKCINAFGLGTLSPPESFPLVMRDPTIWQRTQTILGSFTLSALPVIRQSACHRRAFPRVGPAARCCILPPPSLVPLPPKRFSCCLARRRAVVSCFTTVKIITCEFAGSKMVPVSWCEMQCPTSGIKVSALPSTAGSRK